MAWPVRDHARQAAVQREGSQRHDQRIDASVAHGESVDGAQDGPAESRHDEGDDRALIEELSTDHERQ